MSKPFVYALTCTCVLLLSHSITATIIETQYFFTHDCSGTSFFSWNVSAGECVVVDDMSYAYYPSSDFLFTDIIVFQDTNCTQSQVEGVVHGPVGCGDIGSDGSFWTTTVFHVDADLPVNPLGQFPPTGYAVVTQYLNATTSAIASTCDGVGTKPYLSALRLDCRPANNLQQGASVQLFCNGVEGANFQYSDSQCQNVARVKLEGIPSCGNGQTVSCPSGPNFLIPDLPANLTVGAIQFNNSNCEVNAKTNSTLSLPDVCFANVTMSCYQDVNGTTHWNYAQYNTNDCSGTPVESHDLLPDTCYLRGPYLLDGSVTCTGNVTRPTLESNSSTASSTGGSASATSSSSTGAAVDTAPAQIMTYIYQTSDCSGHYSGYYAAPVGVCYNGSAVSTATYVSADGQFIYQIWYEGLGCVNDAALPYEIVQQPTACGGLGTSYGEYYKSIILHLQNAPVLPIVVSEFPPPNWAFFTTYLNATTSQQLTTCEGGLGTKNFKYAQRYDHCYPDLSTGGSSHFYCSVVSGLSVFVYYSDHACTNLTHARILNLDGCQHGRKQRCPAGYSIPALPKTLSIGYATPDNGNCTTNAQEIIDLFIPNVCYKGVIYSCGLINGTTYFQWKVYSELNCTGAQVDGGTQHPNTCAINPRFQPYFDATCDTVPPPPSGPATSSSSSSSTGSNGNVNASSSTGDGIEYNSAGCMITFSSFINIMSGIVLLGMGSQSLASG